MSTRVLIADDHGMMRAGLRSLIEDEPGMEVVGEAADGHTAVEKASELQPDVVVLDISMPGMNGIEACRHILSDNAEIRVLSLSQFSDARMVTEMFRAGAKGFLLKDAAFDELARAIKVVIGGGTHVSPAVAGDLVQVHVQPEKPDESESVFSVLSDREREVLQMLAEGNSTKEIAGKLYRSVKTVETHRRNIMQKLDLHSLPELTKYAIRQGLTGLDQ